MTDWAKSGRTDTYRFLLCDPHTFAVTGELKGEPSQSGITWDYYSDHEVSATIASHEAIPRNRMVRIEHRIQVDGVDITETMATLFPQVSETEALWRHETQSATCNSMKWALDQAKTADPYSLAVGDDTWTEMTLLANFMTAPNASRLVSKWGRHIVKSHTVPVFWPVGTGLLEALQTVCEWTGNQISVSQDGPLWVDKYLLPSEKPEVYTFEAGRNCIYVPGVTISTGSEDMVNQVVATYEDELGSDRASLRVESGDTSFESCGYISTHVIEVDERVEHEELERMCKAYFEESCGDMVTYRIKHPSVPFVRIGDVVRFINSTDTTECINRRCMVVSQSIDALGPGCMTTTKLKAVD